MQDLHLYRLSESRALQVVQVEERQMLLKSIWINVKRHLEYMGVPSAELGVYRSYVVEGLSRGFSEELREKYIKRGCDPEALGALRNMAKPLEDEFTRIRLRRIKEKLLIKAVHSY